MYRRLIVTICMLLGALSLAGVAQAGDASVRSAIETANKQAKESPELQNALVEIRSQPKSIAKLQKALKDFETVLRKAAATVGAQHASTTVGQEGEADWASGVHKVIHGFEDVGIAVGDIKAHHKTAAKTEIKQAIALIKAGGTSAKTGKSLLGVK